MNNYNSPSYSTGTSVQSMVASAMKKVYVKMTIALVVTALVSLFCASSPAFQQFMFANRWFMWAMVIVELGIVFGVSAGIQKLSSPTAAGLFYLFAVVNGLMLAPIFWVYTGASIAKTFFITAGTFGAMSIFGYTTNQDLSKIGNILFMALIGLIIASVVNIFPQLDPRLDHLHRRRHHLRGPHRLGHPANQAHGPGDARRPNRPSRHPRRPQPLP